MSGNSTSITSFTETLGAIASSVFGTTRSDILTTLALIITIIGFVWTIYSVKKSKAAAEEAAAEAKAIGTRVFTQERVSELEIALKDIEHIKRLNSTGQIFAYPELYGKVQSAVIYFRKHVEGLNDEQNTILQAFITTLSDSEVIIEKKRNAQTQFKHEAINEKLIEHTGKIQGVLAEVKRNMGNKNGQ